MTSPTINSNYHKALALVGSGCLSTAVGFHLESMRIRLLLKNQIGAPSSLTHGFAFGLSLSVLKAGCIWPLQNELRERLNKNEITGIKATIISGGISNVLPNTLLSPLNITKVHMQCDPKSGSCFAVSYNIYRLNGVPGFYHGLPATMVRDSIWGVLYFPSFEAVRKKLIDHYPDWNRTTVDGIASFCAAINATTFTSWIDAVRLHMMSKDRSKNDTLLQLTKRALAPTKANISATALGVMRVGIGTTVAHTSYRTILRYLERKE